MAQSLWSIPDVSAVGRIPEVRRWRCARRHAFESAGFRVDSCSGEVLCDGFDRPISLDPEMVEILASEWWETDPSFTEVPSHSHSSHSWKKVMADRWFSATISSDLKPGPWSKQRSVQPTANQYTTAGHNYSVTIFQ